MFRVPAKALMSAALTAVMLIVSQGAAIARGGRGGFPHGPHGFYGQGSEGTYPGGNGQPLPQSLPMLRPTYLIVDIAEVTDLDGLKTALDKLVVALPSFSGHLIINTDHASALDGTPPGRLLVIAFDDAAKLGTWNDSSERKEFDAARLHSAVSRSYTAEGLPGSLNALMPSNGRHRIRFDPKPFEEIIRQRDKDLEKMKSICKGC